MDGVDGVARYRCERITWKKRVLDEVFFFFLCLPFMAFGGRRVEPSRKIEIRPVETFPSIVVM